MKLITKYKRRYKLYKTLKAVRDFYMEFIADNLKIIENFIHLPNYPWVQFIAYTRGRLHYWKNRLLSLSKIQSLAHFLFLFTPKQIITSIKEITKINTELKDINKETITVYPSKNRDHYHLSFSRLGISIVEWKTEYKDILFEK